MKRDTIFYATRSSFKTEELDIISKQHTFLDNLGNTHLVGEFVDFRVSGIPTDEPLEVDLEAMVRHKARSAYKSLLAPCIVEHAGLIFEKNAAKGFPGGLTQPMWDSLSPAEFLIRTNSSDESAIARSVIGYCDGRQVKTFIGETKGKLAPDARGSRGFYWDVVFRPEGGGGRTYAEIADGGVSGVAEKLKLSQSTKALIEFVSYLHKNGGPEIFVL